MPATDCRASSVAALTPRTADPACAVGAEGGSDETPESGGLQGLNCAGYGSSVTVTAAFGLVAAARVMALLAQ